MCTLNAPNSKIHVPKSKTPVEYQDLCDKAYSIFAKGRSSIRRGQIVHYKRADCPLDRADRKGDLLYGGLKVQKCSPNNVGSL